MGVRVYMAEQAPCVQTHDVVPNDYSNYLTNVQKTAKKKKGSAQLVGVASGLRGRKEFDSLSDTEEPEQEQEEPTDANDSLGWAALWKVTKVVPPRCISNFQRCNFRCVCTGDHCQSKRRNQYVLQHASFMVRTESVKSCVFVSWTNMPLNPWNAGGINVHTK